MKTDKVYFHCRNNEADSDLVRAIEALPEEGMLIIPYYAEMGCMKKDSKIIIYPHNLEEQLVTMGHIIAEHYDEHLMYSEFKIKEFSYEVLRHNPFKIYENVIKNELYEQVMKEEKKEKTIEDYIWISVYKG